MATKRVTIKVERFFEYDNVDVKPGGDVEFDMLRNFVAGFATRAAEKLVTEHGFNVKTVGEVLDCVLWFDKKEDERPSVILERTVKAQLETTEE